jgi:hypothetical protein
MSVGNSVLVRFASGYGDTYWIMVLNGTEYAWNSSDVYEMWRFAWGWARYGTASNPVSVQREPNHAIPQELRGVVVQRRDQHRNVLADTEPAQAMAACAENHQHVEEG